MMSAYYQSPVSLLGETPSLIEPYFEPIRTVMKAFHYGLTFKTW